MKWEAKYTLGIEQIDDQHQMFFYLITKLDELSDLPNFHDDLPRVLNEIVEYAAFHFKKEEALMASVQFDGLEAHHDNHEKIKKDIYQVCKNLVEKEFSKEDVKKLVKHLEVWIDHHILETDQQYVTAVKNKQ